MKNLKSLLFLSIVAASILIFISSGTKTRRLYQPFTRNYSAFSVSLDTVITLTFPPDILASFNGRVVSHNLTSKSLTLLSMRGTFEKRIFFQGTTPVSSLHSLSPLDTILVCTDLNDGLLLSTNFNRELQTIDSLPNGIRGAVVNPAGRLTYLQYDSLTGDVILKNRGKDLHTDILAYLENYSDFGYSHIGNMLKNELGDQMFYVPFYNSRIITYNYGNNRIGSVNTIDAAPVTDVSILTREGRTLSNKAEILNRKAAANNEWLFIVSYAESADNEENEVIDMYDLKKNGYAGSVKIKNVKRKKVNAFTCHDNKIFLGVDKQILIYDIRRK